MNKRGISPLIATVLIVGITIVVAVVIITFGQELIQGTVEREGGRAELLLSNVQIKAHSYNFDCGINELQILIENKGQVTVEGFVIEVTASNGATGLNVGGLAFTEFDRQWFIYTDPKFDCSLGTIQQVKVTPKVTVNGELVVATQGASTTNIQNTGGGQTLGPCGLPNPLCNGLVLFLSMDNHDSVNVFDDSGNNLHASYTGGATEASNIITTGCRSNHCLLVQPITSERLSVTHDANLDLSSASGYTLMAYVKPDQTDFASSSSTYPRVIYKFSTSPSGFSTSPSGYDFFINRSSPPGAAFGLQSGDGASLVYFSTSQTQNPFDANWHHIAIVVQNGNVDYFFDGNPVTPTAPLTYSAPMSNTINDLIIGNTDVGNRELAGFIDEVRIYNIPLSQAEISQSLNAFL